MEDGRNLLNMRPVAGGSSIFVALGLVASLLLGACAPSRTGASSGGGEGQATSPKRVVAAIRSAPASLSNAKTNPPGLTASAPGLDGLQETVAVGMVRFDNQDTPRPALGETVPSSENGLWKVFSDGSMETTWTIREAGRWQDGAPVTAADFLFAMEVEQDKDLGIPRHQIYDLIDKVQAPDPHTVVVKWKQPYIDADATFSSEVALPLPVHLLQQSYREDKAGFLGLPYWSDQFIGTGPYKVREWVTDSHVLLDAYDQYVLGRPKIDQIEIKFIPDPNALLASLLAGSAELTLGRTLDFENGGQLANQWQAGTVKWRGSGWFKTSPQFVDTRPVIVADARFRRALMYATDRQELGNIFMGGRAAVADTLVPIDAPEFTAVADSIVHYEYDPSRAVQMIEGLGYVRDSDGSFRDSTGTKLALELRTTIGLAIQQNITLALADYWKRAGVDVTVVPISVQQMADREYRATFPAFEMVSAGLGLRPEAIARWRSSKSPLPDNRFQVTGNDPRYQNPEFDALIDRYVTTIPREPRLQALAGLVHHQTDQLNIMGLFYSVNPSPVANRLQHVSARASRSSEAWNIQDWDLAS